MNLYHEIQSNKRMTVVLVAGVMACLLLVGYGWGLYMNDPGSGLVMAAVFSFFYTLIGYFFGDKVALSSSGAQAVTKAEAPDLYRLVENLSITAGLPLPKIYIIPDSSPNAFATGRDPEHASVAVTTGLMQLLTKQELEGVIAHELSHIKNYDIRVMTLVAVLVGAVLLLSDWLTRSFFWGNRRRDDREGGGGAMMIVGLILIILSPIFAELIKLAISRKREYLADASGALLTRYPEGLASALEKIAKLDQPLAQANHATAHLFLANPFDPHVTAKFESWFSTHPPIEERIKKLRGFIA